MMVFTTTKMEEKLIVAWFEEQSVSMDMKTLPKKHFPILPGDVPVSIAAIAASSVSTTATPGASSKTLTDALSTEANVNVTKL